MWRASQVLLSGSYGMLCPVALLMGRAVDTSPRQMPAQPIVVRGHSRSAIAVLVGVPILVFGLPALVGHPVVPSDDLTQNFPLRVLVGRQISQGQLPLFDPYIWSGAPLLGGWNAGAAYPLTWVFAVMPGAAAWTINLIVTSWLAGVGTFAFLRASRLSRVASFLGGLTFAFTGAMAAQVPHYGFVAGMSWAPVALLAMRRLTERRPLRGQLAWTAALAGACAMVILAGEPRAIDDAVVVIAMYGMWQAWRLGRRSGRASYVGLVSLSVALGAAIGAVQWLPGIDAVHSSQRAVHSAALFVSGSLAPKWLLLSIVPNLLGGSGSFGEPTFFARYNLAEVTGYVGLMPLAAAFALLGRLRWRPRLPEWFVWHVVALVGVLLALGGNTVLGPSLMHLPLFGDQRLQSRNIMMADLALAVLLAYGVDSWLREPAMVRRRLPSRRQLLGIVPAVGAVAVVTTTLAWGAGMLGWLGLTPGMANQAGPSAPWLVPFLILALLSIGGVVWGPKLTRRRRAQFLVGFVVLDVGIFTLLTMVSVAPGLNQPSPPKVQSATASPARGLAGDATPAVVPLSDVVHQGRFAIFDPNELDVGEFATLGVSDSNLLSETPSVEGYSSIVDNTYAQVTGSHQATGQGQNVLDPTAISDGTLDALDTTVLLTPSAYLVTSNAGPPSSTGADPGRRSLAPGQSGQWYMGRSLDMTSLTIPVRGGGASPASGVRVGLVGPSGSTRWEVPIMVAGHGLEVTASRPRAIVSVRVEAGPTSLVVGAPSIETVEGDSYRADGQLQDAVLAPHWLFHGFDGAFAVFANSLARPPLALRAGPGGSAAGATIRATGGPAFSPTSAEVSSPRGVTVVRSGAAIPGWTATWQPSGGAAPRALVVRRSGVVQTVTVPPGSGRISWGYVGPGVRLGLWLSSAGVVAWVAVAVAALLWRRRPKRALSHLAAHVTTSFTIRAAATKESDGLGPWRPARDATPPRRVPAPTTRA